MTIVFLLLIVLPFVTWLVTSGFTAGNRWMITSAMLGAVVYPFFTGLGIVFMYLAQTLFPLIQIAFFSAKVAIFHRAAGYMVVGITTGSVPRGDGDVRVYVASAIVWAIVYGFIGRYFGRRTQQAKVADERAST